MIFHTVLTSLIFWVALSHFPFCYIWTSPFSPTHSCDLD